MSALVSRERRSLLPFVCVVVLSWSHLAVAEEALGCDAELRRSNLVACAEERSPTVAVQLAALRGSEGRREAARPFLPANPTLTGSIASRTGVDARALNWTLTLAQELEVAGQSGLRVGVAESDVVAGAQQVSVVRAQVAEQVWLTFFEMLAARHQTGLARRFESATQEVSRTVNAMAANGLVSTVDAAVAEAAAVKAASQRIELDRQTAAAEIRLRQLAGSSLTAAIVGELEPLQLDSTPPAERIELALARSLRLSSGRRVELLRRSRTPNPLLSLFAQNDGFNEKVYGVGLGIPIPLPQPVGRTLVGEISEAVAREEELQAELERQTREFEAQRSSAQVDFDRGRESVALFTLERIRTASTSLDNIAAQVTAARLSVRDALIAQQSLMELLKAQIDARHALCVASVRLARATGRSLEGRVL